MEWIEGDDRMMVLDAFWREFQAKEVALGPEHARTVEARQRAKLVFLLLRELQNYRTGKRTAGTSVTRRQSLRQLKKKGKPRGVIVLSSDDDDDGGEDGGEDEEYTGEVASTSKKALQTLPSLAALKRKASVGQQVQPTARDESSEKGGSTVASGGEGDEPLDEPSEDDEDEAGEAGEAGDGEDEEDEQMAEPGDEVDEEDEEDERMAEPDEDNGDVGMAALALDEPAPGERGGRRPPAAEESGGGKSDAMPHRKESRTEKRKPPMMAASSVSSCLWSRAPREVTRIPRYRSKSSVSLGIGTRTMQVVARRHWWGRLARSWLAASEDLPSLQSW